MGILFEQTARNFVCVNKAKVLDLINDIKAVSKESKLSIDQVISIWQIAEKERQNSLYVHNGDIFDEQMAGFGELIRNMAWGLTEISEAVYSINSNI